MIRTLTTSICVHLGIIISLGCHSAKEAQLSEDNHSCRSVVELSIVSDTAYSTNPPMMILKRPKYTDESRYLRGGIMAVSDTGIVFRRAVEGSRTSTWNEFVPYELIECLVDSNNQIVYGQWKGSPQAEWEVRLVCEQIGPTEPKPFSLLLEPNSTSSYCLAPGRYKLNYIEYSSSDYYLHRSYPLLDCTFDVQSNMINYIGTLQTEYRWAPSDGMAVVPTVVVKHRGMNAAAAMAAVQPFGVIGGLVVSVVGALSDSDVRKRASRTTPYHALRIVVDPAFRPVFQGRLPIRHAPILLNRQAP